MNKHNLFILYIAIATFFFCAALAGFFIHSIVKIAEETSRIEQQTRESLEYEQKLLSLQRALEGNEAGTAVVDSFFVKSSEIVPFIETIETHARESGVTSSLKKVEEQDGMLTLDITTVGSWENTMNFVLKLEALPYRLVFTDVRFTAISAEGQSKGWQTSFTLQGIVKK